MPTILWHVRGCIALYIAYVASRIELILGKQLLTLLQPAFFVNSDSKCV